MTTEQFVEYGVALQAALDADQPLLRAAAAYRAGGPYKVYEAEIRRPGHTAFMAVCREFGEAIRVSLNLD